MYQTTIKLYLLCFWIIRQNVTTNKKDKLFSNVHIRANKPHADDSSSGKNLKFSCYGEQKVNLHFFFRTSYSGILLEQKGTRMHFKITASMQMDRNWGPKLKSAQNAFVAFKAQQGLRSVTRVPTWPIDLPRQPHTPCTRAPCREQMTCMVPSMDTGPKVREFAMDTTNKFTVFRSFLDCFTICPKALECHTTRQTYRLTALKCTLQTDMKLSRINVHASLMLPGGLCQNKMCRHETSSTRGPQ